MSFEIFTQWKCGFNYVYLYKDHLGNVRLSYSDTDDNGAIDPNTEILHERNFYPYGLEYKGYKSAINGVENNYQTYQGKEHQKELSLNWHDFSARNYDAAIGRWMSVDPLAEQMRRYSPFNYAFNNPLRFIDPDGMAPVDWYKKKETDEIVWMEGHKNYEGYVNLGYYYNETDVDGNRTFYNGDDKTKSVNGEVIESFEPDTIRKGLNFVTDNIVSPIIEGAETFGYIVYGTGVMVGEMVEDIKEGGDGTSLRVDMDMPMYEFNNGKLVKTDMNESSERELIESGVSFLSVGISANTGYGKVTDLAIGLGVKSGAKKVVNEATDDENEQ